MDRLIGVMAGLLGAAGVAASAAGAHAAAGANLETAGTMLILHAAAIVALAVPSAASPAARRVAALMLVAGVCLFAGDLAMRALAGARLFPLAAPAGGFAMMAGWVLAGFAFLIGRRA